MYLYNRRTRISAGLPTEEVKLSVNNVTNNNKVKKAKEKKNIYIYKKEVYVCLSVCLFVCLFGFGAQTTGWISTKSGTFRANIHFFGGVGFGYFTMGRAERGQSTGLPSTGAKQPATS